MNVPSDSVRERLEMQGFSCDVSVRAGAAKWLRFTPLLATSLLTTATALRAPYLFWAFGVISVFGSLGVHAFDLVFNRLVRHVVDAERLPENPRPRRFAMLAAAMISALAGVLFARGSPIAGTTVGAFLAVAGLLSASTHFCIGSWMYWKLGLRPGDFGSSRIR